MGCEKIFIDKSILNNMVWQDFALMIVGIIFVYSVIPQIYVGFKKKKGLITFPTAISAVLAVSIQTVALFTLNLYFSAIVSLILLIGWFILFIQRIIYSAE